MLRRIMFNSNTSEIYKENNLEWNLSFLKSEEGYFNCRLRALGYVYLNDIFEALAIKWDPKWDNTCFVYDGKNEIVFDVSEYRGDIDVCINWPW